jgi:D-psicose/D-tagatose/L-ribulose 3-epimerase
MVVEAFGLALPAIAAATKIWRKMYATEEQLAGDALAFMKAHVGKRWG